MLYLNFFNSIYFNLYFNYFLWHSHKTRFWKKSKIFFYDIVIKQDFGKNQKSRFISYNAKKIKIESQKPIYRL